MWTGWIREATQKDFSPRAEHELLVAGCVNNRVWGHRQTGFGGVGAQANDLSQEVVLGDVGLREVRGLEHDLEVPAMDFGFDHWLQWKVFSLRRWENKSCLSGALRLLRNAEGALGQGIQEALRAEPALTVGPGPAARAGHRNEPRRAVRSDTKSWPEDSGVSTLGLSTLVGGHTGCQLSPMLEVPPRDEAYRGLRPTRRGALPAVVYAPWGRSLLRGQLPSPLLWLRHSSSLSAFEFQSKPEADCKQMDGVIKTPQAGSKEACGYKREAPLEELYRSPCWVPASVSPAHSLLQTDQPCLLLTHPNPTCFQGPDQPQSSQADFCDFLSQTLYLPTHLATRLLCLWAPGVMTSHTPSQRSPAYTAGSLSTLNNLSKYILGIISENTFPLVINPVLDKRLMLNQCYIFAFLEKATLYNFSNSGQEVDDVNITSKQLPQGFVMM